MAFTVIIHLSGTDPFLAEMDELPDPQASTSSATTPGLETAKTLSLSSLNALAFCFPGTASVSSKLTPAMKTGPR